MGDGTDRPYWMSQSARLQDPSLAKLQREDRAYAAETQNPAEPTGNATATTLVPPLISDAAAPERWPIEAGIDSKMAPAITVAFIGPIAGEGEPARGGFESANRRTITLLRQHGVEVLELPYPVARGPTWIKTLLYLQGFVRIALSLVRRAGSFQLVHITPLRRQFILPEMLLCRLTQMLKKRLLLDLRAGDLVSSYQERGAFHRNCLAIMISTADVVGSEGNCYVRFLVETLKASRVVYLPNFTTIPRKRDEIRFDDLDHRINIVMLGRVAPEKGAGLGIEIVRLLRNANVPARLTIIGTGAPTYIDFLMEHGKDLPVLFAGSLNPLEIEARLSKEHIFLFPTRHFGEGHSNALTEAMAAGLVPVCSDHGFNEDVVGDCGFILSTDSTADNYASVLLAAIRSPGLLKSLSFRARSRAECLFSDAHVIPVLLDEYNNLARSMPRGRGN
ncbi:glycosyltransferase family 4 protein [Bradyrhizobium sp. McL0616]|uniref:glycosyltransferase family 4 protein n=1 Tax=Bradyrhizobium sp. McL0616 TaxID=3415674 RepID=UPI003CF55EFF